MHVGKPAGTIRHSRRPKAISQPVFIVPVRDAVIAAEELKRASEVTIMLGGERGGLGGGFIFFVVSVNGVSEGE